MGPRHRTATLTSATTSSIRQHNRTAIAGLLYHGEPSTKQQISTALGLSLPTVTENLETLETQGIVVPSELRASTGGRRARAYAFNSRYRIALGVAVHDTEIICTALDLHGKIVMHHRRSLTRTNDAMYAQRIGNVIQEHIHELDNSTHTQLLGIGICFQDSSYNTAALTQPAVFRRHPYTVISRHEAAAMTELWNDPTIQDAAFICVDRRISCTLILNGEVHVSGTTPPRQFGRMVIAADSEQTTDGSLDEYCALNCLPEDGESLPGFFSVLEQGEIHHRKRMDRWFGYLAQAIANLRCVIPVDIIIGGPIARYFDDADIESLRRRILAIEHTDDATGPAVRASRPVEHTDAYGAALLLVQRYLDNPFPNQTL